MVSHELQGHLKLLYIHILVGCCCCTTKEALVTEMSSAPGLDHGPWQHEQRQIICLGSSLTPSLAQVWVLWEAQLNVLTWTEWRNLDELYVQL